MSCGSLAGVGMQIRFDRQARDGGAYPPLSGSFLREVLMRYKEDPSLVPD
jgi:hypothetical protein